MSLLRRARRVPRPAVWRFLPMLVLWILLGGCAPSFMTQSNEPLARTYLLEWQRGSSAPGARRTGPGLLVSPVLSTPGFDSSEMAYLRREHEIEYFANHRWVDAPARMLEPLLVAAAEQTGLFRSVVEAGSHADVQLRLDSRLLHLQQVWRLQPSESQLAMRLALVDIASGRVIGTRTVSIREPFDERTPYGGVQAANRAVAALLSALQDFLAEQLGPARR